MLKKIAFIALAFGMTASSVSAEGIIRKHIDNTLNNIETAFGNDSAEHEARTLADKLTLRDKEINNILLVLAEKAREREEYAAKLAAMGVETPPPVILAPLVPSTATTQEQTCLTTISGTPIFCW